MKHKERIAKWIVLANNYKVDLPDAGPATQIPLLTYIGNGIYKVLAKTITSPTGTIFSRGNRMRYPGVTVETTNNKDVWNQLTRTDMKAVLRDLKKGGIYNVETQEAAVEAKAPKAKKKEPKAVEPVAVEPKAVEPVAVEPKETPDLKGMTRRQIDTWAGERGIEIDGRMSKKDMIAKVLANL